MEDLHSEIKAGEPMIKQLNVMIFPLFLNVVLNLIFKNHNQSLINVLKLSIIVQQNVAYYLLFEEAYAVINNAIAGNYKVFNLLFFHVFNIFLKKELMEEITSNIN
jgi:hypothetical protein